MSTTESLPLPEHQPQQLFPRQGSPFPLGRFVRGVSEHSANLNSLLLDPLLVEGPARSIPVASQEVAGGADSHRQIEPALASCNIRESLDRSRRPGRIVALRRHADGLAEDGSGLVERSIAMEVPAQLTRMIDMTHRSPRSRAISSASS